MPSMNPDPTGPQESTSGYGNSLPNTEDVAAELESSGKIALILAARSYLARPFLLQLLAAGYGTSERPLDHDGVQALRDLHPDLLVCVLDPADSKDLLLLKALRKRTRAVVAVVTPGPPSRGFVECFQAGADFCFAETDPIEIFGAHLALLERLKARQGRPLQDAPSIGLGDFHLDMDARRILYNDSSVRLGPKEARILARLAHAGGRTVTFGELLEAADGRAHGEYEASQITKVHIRRIREKLESVGLNPGRIVNVRGIGYVLTQQQGGGWAGGSGRQDRSA
jgi:DNA-binding response OmpR family regulator